MNKTFKIIISIVLGFFTVFVLFRVFNLQFSLFQNPCNNINELTAGCESFLQGDSPRQLNYVALILVFIYIFVVSLIYYLILSKTYSRNKK